MGPLLVSKGASNAIDEDKGYKFHDITHNYFLLLANWNNLTESEMRKQLTLTKLTNFQKK